MRKYVVPCLVIVGVLAAPCGVEAGGTLEEKVQTRFGGGMGKVLNRFGGKATREGLVTTTVIDGERKASTSGDSTEIVDLAEEAVYRLNLSRKTYTVTTFQEMRERMGAAREAWASATAGPRGEAPPSGEEGGEAVPEYEVEISVEPQEGRETIHGFDCRPVRILITSRRKGMTLEEGGGGVMTTDLMIGPKLPVVEEVAAFQRKYVEQLGLLGGKEEQLVRLLTLNPALREAMQEFETHRDELDGTPIRTTLTLETVADPGAAPAGEEAPKPGAALRGALRGFGKKFGRKKKQAEEPPAAEAAGAPAGAPARKVVFTSTSEVLGASSDVASGALAIPDGFKRKGK